LPVGILYWLMRPMAFPNPGISAYQAPRSNPTIPRVSSGVHESYALSITAAKRENERLHGKSRSGFAASARQQSRRSDAVVMVRQTRQRSARKQRPQSPFSTAHDPRHFWEFRSQGFGMRYR